MATFLANKDFFRGASIGATIPHNAKADLADGVEYEIEDEDETDDDGCVSILPVKQRTLLFFDEKLTAYVVLKLPFSSVDTLPSHLSSLNIKVDVWLAESNDGTTDGANRIENNDQAQELLFSTHIPTNDDPIVIVKNEDDDRGGYVSTLLLWEILVTLNRPRHRYANPSISLTVSAAVADNQPSHPETEDEYLPSFQPLQANVLEPFKAMPTLQGHSPYLAASRLERVLPSTPISENVLRIHGSPSKPIRIAPALIAKMRTSRINRNTFEPVIIASLDIEVVPFVDIRASLEDIEVSLMDGDADSLMPTFLPMACQSKDCITFLYKLSLRPRPSESLAPELATKLTPKSSNIGRLSVSLRMKIAFSESCTPMVYMDWTTDVDLSSSLNPSFGPPARPFWRPNRPSSLALPDSSDAPPAHSSSWPDKNVTITFSAPPMPIQVNKPFSFALLVVNNTSNPVKLAIIPMPRLQQTTAPQQQAGRGHASKFSSASTRTSDRRHPHPDDADVDIAQAVCDENVLYAMQHSQPHPSETDLISLTAEVRIGPLGPGACHECEVKMLALRTGAMRVDAMRVVDLVREAVEGIGAKGVVTDVKDLPDINVE